MREIIIKLRVGLIFCFLSFQISQAQVNSPYSRIGLGNLFPNTFSASNGMAGLSAAQFYSTNIQMSNPASYSYLVKTVFDGGLSANYLQLQTSTEEFKSGDANLGYLALGFSPDSKKSKSDFGFSSGLVPFSGFQYDIEEESTIDSLIGLQTTNYRGEGTVYQYYIGASYNYDFDKVEQRKGVYSSNVGIGINYSYLFGSLQNITVASFPELENSKSTKYVRTTELNGSMISLGFAFQKTFGTYDNSAAADKKDSLYTLNLGGSISPGASIESMQNIGWFNINKFEDVESIIDTLLVQNDSASTIYIPTQFQIGVGFNNFSNTLQNTKFSIGLDYTQSMWSLYEGYQYTDSLANSYKIKVGSEIIPNADSIRHYNYRVGFYYGKSHLLINGEQLTDVGLTLGLGIPIGRRETVLSKINLALNFGRRGTKDFVQENYVNMQIGFNLNDLSWFRRRQLN